MDKEKPCRKRFLDPVAMLTHLESTKEREDVIFWQRKMDRVDGVALTYEDDSLQICLIAPEESETAHIQLLKELMSCLGVSSGRIEHEDQQVPAIVITGDVLERKTREF